jgi:hypothetical protein
MSPETLAMMARFAAELGLDPAPAESGPAPDAVLKVA